VWHRFQVAAQGASHTPVFVRIGSIATTNALFLRASRTGRHKSGCVDREFAPQSSGLPPA